MLAERLVCERTGGAACIAMLVASGLIVLGVNPVAITSYRPSVAPVPALRPALAVSTVRQIAPASGPVRRRDRLRRAFPFAWRFQGQVAAFSVWSALPCGLAHSFRFLSGDLVPPLSGFDAGPGLSRHSIQAASSLPTAARLSLHLRFAAVRPEELSKRVFRRCCGHRSYPDQVEFSCSLSGCYTRKRQSNLPFRPTEAAPVERVAQAKNERVIHRRSYRWWTNAGEAVEEVGEGAFG